MIADLVKVEMGPDILVPAKLEEVEPNKEFYRASPIIKNQFTKMTFAPEVEWDTVVELVNANLIYARAVAKPNQVINSQSPGNVPRGNMQSTLF